MQILNQLRSNLAHAKTKAMREFCTERLQEYIRASQPRIEPKRQPNWDRFIPNEFLEK